MGTFAPASACPSQDEGRPSGAAFLCRGRSKRLRRCCGMPIQLPACFTLRRAVPF
jgi:hypothetical protein